MTGRWLFDVRDPKTSVTKTFTQDDIFYLRGAGGKGILEYARTSLGTALATESYAAAIFGRGTLNGGVIETPGTLDEEAGKRMAKSFVTGSGNWHLPKVLEQGSKWVQNEMTPDKSQMVPSRMFTIDDMARWLGVPRLMLENSDPSYGNAEQFTANFIDINMGGWLALWEFGVNDQLILNPAAYFVRFTREAFIRSKYFERWQAHVMAVNAGIMSVDEVRGVEDWNKRGGKADELREPQNITGKPAAPSSAAELVPTPKTAPSKAPAARAAAIATESAGRLLRKEIAAVQKFAVRFAADGDGFAVAVSEFYATHVALVRETLQMTETEAQGYCAAQSAQALSGWVTALEAWKEPDYAAGLALLALDGEAA